MLEQLAERHLDNGKTGIKVDRHPIRFDDFIERFVRIFGTEEERIDRMKDMAEEDGVSHLHLCMLHYQNGMPKELEVAPSEKAYERWKRPVGSDE
jgi:hypothetical protein